VKSVTREDIKKKALSERLDAIAITDHNTGAWVEISATARKRGTFHIIGIFDQSKTT
jgi:predicted metal-dependent phosphoesterase TrpH